MGKIHKFFAEFDMFAAQPTLRAKQQPQSSSIFSGVLSLIFALFFSYVFIINAVGIFTYSDIQSLQTESVTIQQGQKLSGNQVKARSIFFAIRVGYLTADQSLKYFNIGYNIMTEDGKNITQTLSVCKKEQWAKLGDQYESQFDQYQMGEFFCPDNPNANVSLFRSYYAENPRFITVFIRPCTGYRGCQNQTIHKQFVENVTNQQGATFLLAYFLDEVINPQSKQPVSYTINTDVQLAFTTKRGIIATVEFGSYRIQTDMGFMPVQEQVIHQGNFVHSFRQTSIQLKNFEDNYALIYLSMNRKYMKIQRKVGKIDEMLSYVGGLFSILIGALSIFMNSFNQYRYELMVAEGVFHEDQQGNRIREDDFHFLKYIKYSIFDWVQTLFCFTLKWNDCILIDNTRQQANCTMDVTRLFRKIQTMDNTILHVVDKSQKDCLALVKPQSLGKIKRNRMILQYYEAIVQGKQVLTIEEYIMSKKILKFGIWLARMHENEGSISEAAVGNSNCQIISDENSENSVQLDQIEDKDKMLEVALGKFKQLEAEAEKIKLSQQLMEIEQSLAEQFCELSYQARVKIQQKIPIIILHRLKKHADMQKIHKSAQKSQSKERKVLNPLRPTRNLKDCPLVEFERPQT